MKHAEAKEVAVSLKTDPLAGHEARLLQGLRVVGAGFIEQAPSFLAGQLPGAKVLTLFYCIKGSGWCEAAGRLHTVRKGDVLILVPGGRCSYGSSRAEPWSSHWVQAAGDLVPDYLDAVGAIGPSLLVSAGRSSRPVFHRDPGFCPPGIHFHTATPGLPRIGLSAGLAHP